MGHHAVVIDIEPTPINCSFVFDNQLKPPCGPIRDYQHQLKRLELISDYLMSEMEAFEDELKRISDNDATVPGFSLIGENPGHASDSLKYDYLRNVWLYLRQQYDDYTRIIEMLYNQIESFYHSKVKLDHSSVADGFFDMFLRIYNQVQSFQKFSTKELIVPEQIQERLFNSILHLIEQTFTARFEFDKIKVNCSLVELHKHIIKPIQLELDKTWDDNDSNRIIDMKYQKLINAFEAVLR